MRRAVTRQELESAMRDAHCHGDLDAVLASPLGTALRIALTNTVIAQTEIQRIAITLKTKFDARRAAAGDFDSDLEQ